MERIECRYNPGVGCMDPSKCFDCGWNPAAAKRRVAEKKAGEQRKRAKTYFKQITASPEALAAFLASIPALETPWDKVFQRTYCAVCSAENCDAGGCPHQAQRNSPAWFLAQEVADDGNDPLW